MLRLLGFFIGLFICINAQAHFGISLSIVPPPQDVIVEPAGYYHCYTVGSQFYHGVWIYQHRVCEYDNGPGPGLWISGYWRCVRYLPNGACLRSSWVRAHWVNQYDMEYYAEPVYEPGYAPAYSSEVWYDHGYYHHGGFHPATGGGMHPASGGGMHPAGGGGFHQ